MARPALPTDRHSTGSVYRLEIGGKVAGHRQASFPVISATVFCGQIARRGSHGVGQFLGRLLAQDGQLGQVILAKFASGKVAGGANSR
jgi:hypothetical protein